MKKKLFLTVSLLICICGIIYGALAHTFNLNDKTLIGKLRASSSENNVIIESISSKFEGNNEIVTMKIKTEWDGLYLETSGSGITLTPQERTDFFKETIKKAITPTTFLNALAPNITNDTGINGILYNADELIEKEPNSESSLDANSIKARQFIMKNPKQKTPITINGNSFTVSDDVEISENLDTNTKYDFVFVVEATHLSTVAKPGYDSFEEVRKQLASFTRNLKTKGVDYRANIVEFGGRKAMFSNYLDGTKVLKTVLTDGNGNPTNTWSNSENIKIIADTSTKNSKIIIPVNSNPIDIAPETPSAKPQKPNLVYPEDIFLGDSKTGNDEFYALGYTKWLTNSGNFDNSTLKKAIDLIGVSTGDGSATKETGGNNAVYGLYEAVNFLVDNKASDRIPVIVLLNNQWMKATKDSFGNMPELALTNADTSSSSKDKFISWFSNKMNSNGIKFLVSASLGEASASGTGVPDDPMNATNSKDPLGNPVTDSYNSPTDAIHPNVFKQYLLGNMTQYEGSKIDYPYYLFQINLESILNHFIGQGRFYQRWTVTYKNIGARIVPDSWKKVLFSLKDFFIDYNDGYNNLPVKTRVILKKEIDKAYTDASQDPRLLKSIDTGTTFIDKYYDRYYYTPQKLALIFDNPYKDKNWEASSLVKNTNGSYYPKYTIKFHFETATTPLQEIKSIPQNINLKINILGGESLVINDFKLDNPPEGYTVTKSLSVDKKKYEVSIELSEDIINSIIEKIDPTSKPNIKFDVSSSLVSGECLANLIRNTTNSKSAYGLNQSAYSILSKFKNEHGNNLFNQDGKNLSDTILNDELEKAIGVFITSSDDENNIIYLKKDMKNTFRIALSLDLDNPLLLKSSTDQERIDYINYIKNKLSNNGVIITSFSLEKISDSTYNLDFIGEFTPTTLSLINLDFSGIMNKNGVSGITGPTVKLQTIADPSVRSLTFSPNIISSSGKKYFNDNNTGASYDLTFSKVESENLSLLGYLLPIKRDFSDDKIDMKDYTKPYLNPINDTVEKNGIFWASWKGNGTETSISLKKYSEIDSGANRYDGIYTVENLLPFNKAGGIASIGTLDKLALAFSNKFSTVFVVDTIAPRVSSIKKTHLVYSDGTYSFTKENAPFNISSSNENSWFLGPNKPGKTGDEYTVNLVDANLSNDTSNIKIPMSGIHDKNPLCLASNILMWDLNIDNLETVWTQDDAGNCKETGNATNTNESRTALIVADSTTPRLMQAIKLDLDNKNTKESFLKDVLSIFPTNNFANALSIGAFNGDIILTTNNNHNIRSSMISGQSAVAFGFTEGGRFISQNFILDDEINYNNNLESVYAEKNGNNWIAKINLGPITELAGINKVEIDSIYTNINNNSNINTIETYASNIFSPTRNKMKIGSSELPIPLYNIGLNNSIILPITIFDKLGNYKTFNTKVSIPKYTKIIGATDGHSKVLESTITNSGKTSIKAQKQMIK